MQSKPAQTRLFLEQVQQKRNHVMRPELMSRAVRGVCHAAEQ